MDDLLIEILALDNLVKTYRQQLIDGITFEDAEQQMIFYDIHDRAYNLMAVKVDQLPESARKELIPLLNTYGQV